MRGSSLRALRRLVQSEPELTALSGRLLASSLAAQPSAAAIGALARNEPGLQRLAQRLLGTLAASAARGSGGRGLGAGLPARVRQSERLQVRPVDGTVTLHGLSLVGNDPGGQQATPAGSSAPTCRCTGAGALAAALQQRRGAQARLGQVLPQGQAAAAVGGHRQSSR